MKQHHKNDLFKWLGNHLFGGIVGYFVSSVFGIITFTAIFTWAAQIIPFFRSLTVLQTMFLIISTIALSVALWKVRNSYFQMSDGCKIFADNVKKFICYNQGQIVQYSLAVSEKHKELKKLDLTPENIVIIEEAKEKLENTVSKQFRKIMLKNSKHILRFFKDREGDLPRITIKIYSSDGNDNLIGVYTSHDEYIPEHSTQDDSGSKYIWDEGKDYICNNIPKAILADKYFNNRIKMDEAKALLEDKPKDFSPMEWAHCWCPHLAENPTNGELTPRDRSIESCYQSTLVTPLTLINNELSPEFKEHFDIPEPEERNSCQRAVYGVLCLDNRRPEYFIDDVDRKLGYILADIASVYLVTAFMYTDYSTTYQQVESYLSTVQQPAN